MKRLLLIGGIISMVLPAMAEEPTPNTDLRGYNLLNGSPSNPGTCLGPDGYDGFEKGNVTMLPLYIETCNPGQYYNATSETPINSSTSPAGYTWDNGKCLDANSNVINMSEEECLNAVKVDYYYVNACAEVPNGWYYTPVTEEGPTQDPVIENGYLKKTGPEQCPADYRDGSDKYPSTNQYSRTAITDCYRFCGSDEGDKTVSSATLNSLNATNAEYTSDREHYQGADVCTVSIAADGCKTGYTRITDFDDTNYPLYTCPDKGTGEDCTDTVTLSEGTWTIRNSAGTFAFKGTISYTSNTCFASVTAVEENGVSRSVSGLNNINLGSAGVNEASDCLNSGNLLDNQKTVLRNAIIAHYTGGVLTENSTFCMPNAVNITWKDKTLAPDDPARTCTYGGTLNFPTAPEKENYTFKGWTVGKLSD